MNIILYPPNNSIAFYIFNLPVRWYGIILSFAIFVGILFSSFLFRKYVSYKYYQYHLDIMPAIIIFAIIGARIFYVIGNYAYYRDNIIEIFLINHGGISIYGAIFFGLTAVYMYSKKYKFNTLQYLDVLAVTMPLCQSIGRWGNFFNQEAYGAPYSGFLKLFVSEQYRYPVFKNAEFYHPAFLYESILDLIIFLILLFVFIKFNKNIKSGTVCYSYLILYAIVRIVVENIRIDSTLNIFNIPSATIISCLVLVLSSGTLLLNYKK